MFGQKARRGQCLSLIFLRTVTNAISLGCPSADNDGDALIASDVLTATSPVATNPLALGCEYDNAHFCFYNEDGSLHADDNVVPSTGCPSRANDLGNGDASSGITTSPPRPPVNSAHSPSTASASSTDDTSTAHTGLPPPTSISETLSHHSQPASMPTGGSTGPSTGSPPPASTTGSSSSSLPISSAGRSSGFTSPGIPALSPAAFPNTTPKSNRVVARTAAIAGSVSSVAFLVVVITVFLRVRTRRRRIDQRRLPKQFTEAQQDISQDTLPIKAGGVSDSQGPGDDSPILPQTEPGVEGPESGAQPPADPKEEAAREETMTVRMRRVEARLEALATMVLPEDSPPSYTG